ncbi:very-short-patch-repair endonuclease [Hephaestia caeni]|uniref:Very-short-patch-repair endonuclease n=1 Tax=Hephaestia caeni TaxID=645617 RepID=A0A397NGL7_9SPHN|nr:endonuclease domain-containing protein [Hephaestia caeni]RIA35438.1 very-short-patch-repair endonuclease [Hephaestia caeni]
MRLYENTPTGAVAKARDLRRNATDAEKHLRCALKQAFPYLKWRFQVPFGRYVADFLCFSARLVIEVDGGQHAEADTYDTARTRFIEREGYRVLRFWNNEVLENTDGVIEAIRRSLSLWEREGAAKPRKGEGDKEKGELTSNSPSPSQPAAGPLPLPQGEEL